MTFYPSPEPLSVIPAPARYDQMLLRAAGIGIGTDSTQTWSIEDAAAFWLPGWKPSGVSETLPADGVMSLATREFLSLFCGLPSIGLLCGALGKLPRFVRPVENMPYEGVLPHGFFYAAHLAFAPDGHAIRVQLQNTGYQALAATIKRAPNLSRCSAVACHERCSTTPVRLGDRCRRGESPPAPCRF
jgi:hypothetical protein